MDQHRWSHLTPASEVYSIYEQGQFTPVGYSDLVTVGLRTFNSPNPGLDLRIRGSIYYTAALQDVIGESYANWPCPGLPDRPSDADPDPTRCINGDPNWTWGGDALLQNQAEEIKEKFIAGMRTCDRRTPLTTPPN